MSPLRILLSHVTIDTIIRVVGGWCPETWVTCEEHW